MPQRLYAIPAGRLFPGDTLHLDGEQYGVIDNIKVVLTDSEPPLTDGNWTYKFEAVLLNFKDASLLAILRMPYELVTAGLADNLTPPKGD